MIPPTRLIIPAKTDKTSMCGPFRPEEFFLGNAIVDHLSASQDSCRFEGSSAFAITSADMGAGPVLVVAGASNLHLGLAPFAAALDRAIGRHAPNLIAAPGAGRSYGNPAGALGITYPGHLESGLTEVATMAIEGRSGLALLMDIGNDIGYGVPPETVVGWVGALKDALSSAGFRVLIQRPPVRSVSRLTARRLELLARLYFPGRSHLLGEVVQRLTALDEGLAALSGCELLPCLSHHAGPDGIHVKLWDLPPFWDGLARQLLDKMGFDGEPATVGSRGVALLSGLARASVRPRLWARRGRWRESRRFVTRMRFGTTLVRL